MPFEGICTSEPRPPAPGARFLFAAYLKVTLPESIKFG